MKANSIIQWTNKYSHEQGYVKTINYKENYFENTFNREEAQKYHPQVLKNRIAFLDKCCPDNTYEAIKIR